MLAPCRPRPSAPRRPPRRPCRRRRPMPRPLQPPRARTPARRSVWFRSTRRPAISRVPSPSWWPACSAAIRPRCCLTGSGKTFTAANVIEHFQRPRWSSPTTRRSRRSSTASFASSSPTTPSTTSSATTTTTSPRRTSPLRHVHRERRDHQRRDRPHAPRGDARAAVALRRHHRRLGELHLRHRLAESYHGLLVKLERGTELRRDELLRRLVDIQYERNDVDFHRGTFRVRGDVVEIFPAYEESARHPRRVLRRRDRAIARSTPCAARSSAARASHLPRLALRHRAAAAARGHRGHREELRERLDRSTTRRGVSSRSSASSSAPCTTSRCWSRWASATASRTTRATSPAASRASRRRP
jgi:hypothetical protein